MTLERNAFFNGLTVCESCGWPIAGLSETERHQTGCPHKAAGASAARLADKLADLRSTKFGYGTDMLTFELDRDLSVRLECRKDGTFQLRDLHLLGGLTADEATDLVRQIADWRKRRR